MDQFFLLVLTWQEFAPERPDTHIADAASHQAGLTAIAARGALLVSGDALGVIKLWG